MPIFHSTKNTSKANFDFFCVYKVVRLSFSSKITRKCFFQKKNKIFLVFKCYDKHKLEKKTRFFSQPLNFFK